MAVSPAVRFRTVSTIVGAAFMVACGRGAESPQTAEGIPAPEARAASRMVLEEIFRSDDSLTLSNVTGLDVDSRGQLYVSDWGVPSIAVLAPDGRLLRRIGRRGAGPGEFSNPTGVQVLRSDSVQVYDLQLRRITVFAPGGDDVAYVVNTARALGFASEVVRVSGGDQLLGVFRQAFTPSDDPARDAERMDVVRLVSIQGELIRDSLDVFPSVEALVLRNGGAVSVMGDPWGRRGIVRLGSDGRLHRVWTDTLGVHSMSLDGTSLGSWTARREGPPITAADVDLALVSTGSRAQQWRRSIEEAGRRRWPAVAGFVVDDRHRGWLALGGPADGPVEWVVFDDRGVYQSSVLLPARSDIVRVTGGRVYAVEKDDMDVPRIVAYAVQP